jgi:hypothetical protein
VIGWGFVGGSEDRGIGYSFVVGVGIEEGGQGGEFLRGNFELMDCFSLKVFFGVDIDFFL